jgi:hypothetical protein
MEFEIIAQNALSSILDSLPGDVNSGDIVRQSSVLGDGVTQTISECRVPVNE